MKINELVRLLEGLLFLAGDGVAFDDIVGKFDITQKQLDEAVSLLKEKYSQNSGINLISFKNKIQFSTNPQIVDNICEILNPIKEKALTRAALETVAIIAYKQPITRLEIENVRGVNSDYAIDLLQQNNLIEVVGRKDTIGKPLLFGTTENFLKRFQIKNISDLPDYEQLLDRIRVINSKSDNLYNDYDISAEPIIPDNNKNI